MSTRYAILVTNNEGQDQVSDIKQMEGAAPEVPSTHKVVKVPDGVLIGMVRGGKKDAVGGFGFPEGAPGAETRSPVGVTRAEPLDEKPADAPANDAPAAAAPKARAKGKAAKA